MNLSPSKATTLDYLFLFAMRRESIFTLCLRNVSIVIVFSTVVENAFSDGNCLHTIFLMKF